MGILGMNYRIFVVYKRGCEIERLSGGFGENWKDGGSMWVYKM